MWKIWRYTLIHFLVLSNALYQEVHLASFAVMQNIQTIPNPD